MLSEVCRKRRMPAEGVTLSGAVWRRLQTDSTPEKSDSKAESKDAEGVRLIMWANLSGKRTEIQALNSFVIERSFCVFKNSAFFTLFSKEKELNYGKLFNSIDKFQ